MLVHEYLPTSSLNEALEARLVQKQYHPDYPLAILNYTRTTQYERKWNLITRRCRGLIYNVESFEVVARPWEKFFNLGEMGVPPTGTLETITEKLDGILGILYQCPDGQLAIATRGSFQSEMAITATKILRQRYGHFVPTPYVTYLFELVGPTHKIIVDYPEDDLVCLGTIAIEDGKFRGPERVRDWPGRCAPSYTEQQYLQILDNPATMQNVPVKEGVVLRYDSGELWKVKFDRYCEIARAIRGLSPIRIWEIIRDAKVQFDHDTVSSFMREIPEEFTTWAETVLKGLRARFDKLKREIISTSESIQKIIEYRNRIQYNTQIEGHIHFKALFLAFDKDWKRLDKYCWKEIRPNGLRPSIREGQRHGKRS